MQFINFTNALKLTWHIHTIVSPSVGEKGAKSHRGNLSLAQNSIMQMRKSPDNMTLHDPKQ